MGRARRARGEGCAGCRSVTRRGDAGGGERGGTLYGGVQLAGRDRRSDTRAGDGSHAGARAHRPDARVLSTWVSSSEWREEAREAHRLNPLGNVEIARLEVAGSLFGGSHERAREQATVLLARSTRRSSAITSGSRSSMPVTWRAHARRWPPCSGPGRPDVRSQAALAGVEAAAGDTVAARARALAIERGPYMDHHVAYSLGAAWAQLGDARAA